MLNQFINMKKLLPLFVLGTVASAHAQVIIDQVDFPIAGATITYGDDADVTNLTLDVGTTGGGQTFDFTNFETDGLTDVGFYDPATVTGGADFPTADLAVDQIGGIYAFAEVGVGSVDVIGLGGDFAGQLGIPGSVVISLEAEDPWTLFEFPASVSSGLLLDTAVFEGRFESTGLLPPEISLVWNPAPDSVWVKRVINYEANIVGDGTLTDPTGATHNVLKMLVVENSIDTLWGWTASTGWERPPAIVEGIAGLPSNETVYRTRFISKELGYYVVDITTESNGTPISATFQSNEAECCTSVEEVVARGENVIYPNPTNDFIRVRTGGDIYQFNVMDMSGKLLQTSRVTIDGETVELNGLSNGLYIYQMLDEAGRVAHTGRLSVIK
jgi:hypothetical protein